jgi:uncharacterized protein YnzC (UPF0291/DUF896 family)
MLIMNMNELERLNTLADKAMNESATRNELKELNELFNDWNSSVELNLFNYLL